MNDTRTKAYLSSNHVARIWIMCCWLCVADNFIPRDKVKSREQQILIKRMIYMLRPDYEQRVKYNILKDEG